MKKKHLTILAAVLMITAIFFGSFAIKSVQAQAATPPQAGQFGFGPGDETVLAEALGVSVKDITAARAAAFEAAVDKAVSEDLITESQAETLKSRTGLMGWGMLYRLVGSENADLIDEEALFAEALGVSVEDLEAARQANMTARLEAAVEAGTLTQEDADAMAAHQALMQDDEFQAQVQENLQAAVQSAVEAGKLTQAQADALLAQMQNRFGQKGGFGGFFGRFGAGQPGMMQGGCMRGQGMFGGMQGRGGSFGGMQGGQGMFGGMQGKGGMFGGMQGGMTPGGRGGFGPGTGLCDGICYFDTDND